MKRQVLFLVMVLLGLTSATGSTAGDAVLIGEDFNNKRFRSQQPILFVERGVEFLIFTDGSFDFNTELLPANQGNNNFYHRNSKSRSRRSINRTLGAPSHTYGISNRGVLVTHDRLGRVRRIGNVFINYDSRGRIKRVGSVYMSYRRAQLKQVGGLRIMYNRYGEIIRTSGSVNLSNQGCSFCGTSDYNQNHSNNHSNYEDDLYYYKKNGKLKKQKKIKS
ncbi:hypothetical protein [Winogradskyella sp. PE311]|uniref:hypothetical protein n=1 Tax=Winogradskyella sp. PE311 TaxID=3366943 RepID=UPI0039815FBE